MGVIALSIYEILPFVTIVALGLGFLMVFRQRAAARRTLPVQAVGAARSRPPRPAVGRPWWGSPWLWIAVCTVSILLGLVVWPGLFGGVVIVLPFVWIRRPRHEPPMDPRTNGHTTKDAGAFTGE